MFDSLIPIHEGQSMRPSVSQQSCWLATVNKMSADRWE